LVGVELEYVPFVFLGNDILFETSDSHCVSCSVKIVVFVLWRRFWEEVRHDPE
jgi:hypothetical protein